MYLCLIVVMVARHNSTLVSLCLNVVTLSCVILLVSYVLQTFPEQAIHWKIDWPKQKTMIANMKLESKFFLTDLAIIW